ncbi:MAG TPA: HU family DNA-binding protein [Prevotella sp.]
MPVLLKLYQNNNKKSPTKGKWYGRTVMTNMVNTATLAERIERNCTVKRSDVMAVLTELVEVMRDELQMSHSVKLNGFGIFKVGVSTKPVDDPKDFNAQSNVTAYRVNFTPEVSGSTKKGTVRKRAFLEGISAQRAPKATPGADPAAPQPIGG